MKITTTSPLRMWVWLELMKPHHKHSPWACQHHEILGWNDAGDPVFISPRDGRLIDLVTLLSEAVDPELEPGYFAKVLGVHPFRFSIEPVGPSWNPEGWRLRPRESDQPGKSIPDSA